MQGTTSFAKQWTTAGLAISRVLVLDAITAQVLPWTVAFALIVTLSNTADAARRYRQGSSEFKKPEPRNDVGEIAKGPLQIIVSIADQHVTLYSNGVRPEPCVDRRGRPSDADGRLQRDPEGPLPPLEYIQQCANALHAAHHVVGHRDA